MTTLKLPRHTIINNGKFFQQVTEAANRGCKLEWEPSYEFAYQILDTNAFITEDLIREIVAEGGDVTGYPMWFEMSVEDYNNKIVPESLWIINEIIEQDPNDLENVSTVTDVSKPVFKDLFLFSEPVYDVTEDGKELRTYSKIRVLNSVNSEYIPCSQIYSILQNK